MKWMSRMSWKLREEESSGMEQQTGLGCAHRLACPSPAQSQPEATQVQFHA